MRYASRVLVGLMFIAAGILVLWYGSPDHTGIRDALPIYYYGFVGLFAVGFIIASMGLLGADENYPALLSGFVLYFMIGGLVVVFLYVGASGLAGYTLGSAGDPTFWRLVVGTATMWPWELVQRMGIFGYVGQ